MFEQKYGRRFLWLTVAAVIIALTVVSSVVGSGWGTAQAQSVPDALSKVYMPFIQSLLSRSQAQAQSQLAAPVRSASVDQGGAVLLPLLSNNPALARRIGYGVTNGYKKTEEGNIPIEGINYFPIAETLRAGLYLDWSVNGNPQRPQGIDYIRMIRVHQKLSCGDWYNAERETCPYVQPTNTSSSYVSRPLLSSIANIVKGAPGKIWLVGNEIERRDLCLKGNDGKCIPGAHNGQDEILPETYAIAYHDFYTAIKAADPTAKVAIGGIIQATPLRLQYLDRVWSAYQQRYGTTMPVDVWNTHNFIFPERRDGVGADIPAGIEDVDEGFFFGPGEYQKHIDMNIFGQQIRAFRQWMTDHGQQDKPLIVTEYGVMFNNKLMELEPDDAETVANFMVSTFDYFLNTKDCSIGWVADDCRLVQQWVWFSLDDLARGVDVNKHGMLLDYRTGELTNSGLKFKAFVDDNFATLNQIPSAIQ